MKNSNVLKYVLSSFIVLSVCIAEANFKTGKDAVQKLKSYNAESLKPKATRKTDSVGLTEDEIFDRLADAVQIALVEKSNLLLREEIYRVTIIMLKHDPSQYAGELVLPLYQQDKKSFKNEIKKLPIEDQKLLMEAVENALREKSQGHG